MGPLEVRHDDAVVAVPGMRQRALLVMLLLQAGRVVPTDRIMADLWGDDPPGKPRNALQSLVSQLRKALAPAEADGALVARGPGYVLDIDPATVDAARFRQLAGAGRTALRDGDPARAAALLGEALELWRGPALADVAYEDFAQTTVAELTERRLAAVEDRIAADLQLGRHADVVAELERLVGEHPTRERPVGLLMRALYASGRQADALATYQDLRQRLRDELGLDPGTELQTLQQAILSHDAALAAPAPPDGPWPRTAATPDPVAIPFTAQRHNLPHQLTTYVGRETTVTRVLDLIARSRLVTLTGPGGVGKTRLAYEAATRLTETASEALAAPDEIWAVELADAHSHEDVARAVGLAIGLRDSDDTPDASPAPTVAGQLTTRITALLADRNVLLVMDNCEHLLDPVAAVVVAVLRACPHVTVLATSRQPIGVAGETVWSVPPLTVPAADGVDDLSQLLQRDSVGLFVDRATAADPDFALDAHTAGPVAELCRRLDGIPLAIELAAARVRTLPVSELADRLDDRFRLLTGGDRTAPPRHRTLANVMQWSWELLTDPEQRVFARLSVFTGSWTLSAASAVCADQAAGEISQDADHIDPDTAVAVLLGLIDKSLAARQPDAHGQSRFTLLETLRTFAATRLAATHPDGAAAVHDAHARYYLTLAEAAQPELHGPQQRRWLELLDGDHHNLRAALRWTLDEEHDQPDRLDVAVRLTAALAWYWCLRDHRVEARNRLATTVDALDHRYSPQPAAAPAAPAAQLHFWHGWLTLDEYNYAAVERSFDHLAVAARSGDPTVSACRSLLQGLRHLGITGRLTMTWVPQARATQAASAFTAALAGFRAADNAWCAALATLCCGLVGLAQGDADAAEDPISRALEAFRAVDDGWGQVKALQSLGIAAMLRLNLDAAESRHTEGLAIADELGFGEAAATILAQLGSVATLHGDLTTARDRHERSLDLARRLGIRPAVAFPLNGLGLVARRAGDFDEADRCHRQALALYRDVDHPLGVPYTLACLGFATEQRGDAAEAQRLFTNALMLAERLGEPKTTAMALEGLGGAALRSGDPQAAADALGRAQAVRERTDGLGAPLVPLPDPTDRHRITTATKRAMGAEAYATAMQRARAKMSEHRR